MENITSISAVRKRVTDDLTAVDNGGTLLGQNHVFPVFTGHTTVSFIRSIIEDDLNTAVLVGTLDTCPIVLILILDSVSWITSFTGCPVEDRVVDGAVLIVGSFRSASLPIGKHLSVIALMTLAI